MTLETFTICVEENSNTLCLDKNSISSIGVTMKSPVMIVDVEKLQNIKGEHCDIIIISRSDNELHIFLLEFKNINIDPDSEDFVDKVKKLFTKEGALNFEKLINKFNNCLKIAKDIIGSSKYLPDASKINSVTCLLVFNEKFCNVFYSIICNLKEKLHSIISQNLNISTSFAKKLLNIFEESCVKLSGPYNQLCIVCASAEK